MMTPAKILLSLLLTGISTPLFADRDLNSEKAKKLEIRYSMGGFRDTLLFYTFEEEKAILVVTIGQDEAFPVTGRVHLFPVSTTKEDIGKWINNQHSDGLFTDIPTPEITQELPKGIAKVVSSKETGRSDHPGSPPGSGSYKDFEVEFKIEKYDVKDQFKLSEFSGSSKVHVKAK